MKMFKRKATEKLRKRKEKYSNKYAVLLQGARRVGKSTIAENFATAKSSFSDFENAIDTDHKVLVATGKIIAGKEAKAAVTQALKVEVHFYNFPTLDQSQLAEKKFQGKFYVENDPDSADKVVCTTTAA